MSSLFEIPPPSETTTASYQDYSSEYSEYYHDYLACAFLPERRKYAEELWSEFEELRLNDAKFKTQIVHDLNACLWEMYMCKVLRRRGYTNLTSGNEGPDLVHPNDFYVECVSATRGEVGKPYSVPEVIPGFVQDVPEDQMILRITSVFKEKSVDKYENHWLKSGKVNPTTPYLIAINTGALGFPQSYLGVPLAVKALLGLDTLVVSSSGRSAWRFREAIPKGDGVSVLNFRNRAFAYVSGVIFSDKLVTETVGLRPGADCIFINNPYAKNPVSAKFAEKFNSWSVIDGGSGLTLQKSY